MLSTVHAGDELRCDLNHSGADVRDFVDGHGFASRCAAGKEGHQDKKQRCSETEFYWSGQFPSASDVEAERLAQHAQRGVTAIAHVVRRSGIR
jgi:hypothetical protein